MVRVAIEFEMRGVHKKLQVREGVGEGVGGWVGGWVGRGGGEPTHVFLREATSGNISCAPAGRGQSGLPSGESTVSGSSNLMARRSNLMAKIQRPDGTFLVIAGCCSSDLSQAFQGMVGYPRNSDHSGCLTSADTVIGYDMIDFRYAGQS